tara:strand:- start:617 stop:1015 length:399 start_codon:yes stop_codon:yes gene_type:complete
MDLTTKVILIVLFMFFGTLSLFFIVNPNLVSVYPGLGFTKEVMYEWRLRTIIPALYLTICYFIYRFFAGRNPTTTLWPIYIVITSFVITQFIAFFFMSITIAQIICFLISLGIAFSLRMADLKRSRQIIGRF